MTIVEPDLCVIGAGSGGLSVAAGAAQMGASVVLIEGAEMGVTASTMAASRRKRSSPPPRPPTR